MFCYRYVAMVCDNLYADFVVSKCATSNFGSTAVCIETVFFSSFSKLIIPITSQSSFDCAVYWGSVVLCAIRHCIMIAHIIGQPEYIIMYLVCE